MKPLLLYLLFITALVVTSSCKVPYEPQPTTTPTNYLVVEGLINTTDSTFIKLSRTVLVSSTNTVKPELKATVTIESDQGTTYPLKEVGKGSYVAGILNLSAINKYRLRIKTISGGTYLSDFVQAKITPPIDSVTTDAQRFALHIDVNTHDPQNNTRYYRWEYTETWEFFSYLTSGYTYNGSTFIPRTAANQIHHCWGNYVSPEVLLGTSETLTQDVILHSPIVIIPSASEKLHTRYSIIVRQYALTKEAYQYWKLLQTNTENLGGTFDAQPSATIGNIHNVNNAAEPVIGFISAGTFTQTRIFRDIYSLPGDYYLDYKYNPPYDDNKCGVVQVLPPDYNVFINQLVPLSPGAGSSAECADCTLRGSNVKPSFW